MDACAALTDNVTTENHINAFKIFTKEELLLPNTTNLRYTSLTQQFIVESKPREQIKFK